MIIVLNALAGGGTAHRKWEQIEPPLVERCGRFDLAVIDAPEEIGRVVSAGMAAGESQFVAAGGDGTVNAVVGAAMTAPADAGLPIAIGAIGLGSSNDFHQPISPRRCVAAIPCAVDFASAAPRDVGVVRLWDHGAEARRFFLLNASVGVTAHANRAFNAPNRILRRLKPRCPRAAVLYAALTTLLRYANLRADVTVDARRFRGLALTNLAVLKSPHVSGRLRFRGVPDYDSGRFEVHLLSGAGRLARLRFLHSLANHEGLGAEWRGVRTATIAAGVPFPLEFDGEVLETTRAMFSLLPQRLRVCRC